VADVMVIYATIPFVAAALGWLVNREAIDRRTLIASTVAVVGMILIFVNGLGAGRLAGQALSALCTVAFAGMIVLQRRRPNASMIAVNAIGAFGAGAIALSLSPHPALGLFDFAALLVYGLTTIGLAFVLFMEGAKHIPSAEAGLISLLDVVLGPIWVFLAFGENPGAMTVLGGTIVLGAALWRMAPDLKGERLW
jgi:drug/metabolite transporter (DMT)-like permease